MTPLLPPTFIMCVGLVGCGKSTLGAAWEAEGPYRIVLNRDRGRVWLYRSDRYRDADGEPLEELPEDQEAILRSAYIGALQAALLRGWSVFDDNTNLNPRAAADLLARVEALGARIEIWDFTGIDVETCIAQDAGRPEPQGRKVIEMLAERARRAGVL